MILYSVLKPSFCLKKDFARFSINESEYALCCKDRTTLHINIDIVIIIAATIVKAG